MIFDFCYSGIPANILKNNIPNDLLDKLVMRDINDQFRIFHCSKESCSFWATMDENFSNNRNYYECKM